MIALDTSTKIGKSPKKPQVQLDFEGSDDDNDNESENDSISTGNAELESADEGLAEAESLDETDDDTKVKGNPGWADAMQKILRAKKPKRKKTLVLSKAKKLCDVKRKEEENVPFEIDGIKEEVKTEAVENTQKKEEQRQTRKRKDITGIRVKPSITDRERERMLQKIATKGVVQLFNAVKSQQGEINRKLTAAGPLQRKQEKVLKEVDKRAFLDVLMGGSKSIPMDNGIKDDTEKEENTKESEEKIWSVLRDDFVMSAKLKDWDKKGAEEEDSSAPEDMDSDES